MALCPRSNNSSADLMGVQAFDEIDACNGFHEIGHPRAKDQQKQDAKKQCHTPAATLQDTGHHGPRAVDGRGGQASQSTLHVSVFRRCDLGALRLALTWRPAEVVIAEAGGGQWILRAVVPVVAIAFCSSCWCCDPHDALAGATGGIDRM